MKLKFYFSLGLLIVLNCNIIYSLDAKIEQKKLEQENENIELYKKASIFQKTNNQTSNKDTKIQSKSKLKELNNLKTFTLYDILSIAYHKSSKFKSNIALHKKEIHETVGNISALFLPKIEANVRFTNQSSVKKDIDLNKDSQNSYSSQAGLTIQQSIFNFGKDVATARAKYNELLSNQAAFYKKEQEIISDIIAKYIEVQIAKEIYNASKTSLKNNTAIYESEKEKYKIGYSTLNELKIAESNYYNRISDENGKKLEYENSLINLNSFIEIENLEQKNLTLPNLPLNINLSYEKLEQDILNNNFDSIIAKHSKQSATENVKSVAGSLLPSISGQLSLDQTGDSNQNPNTKSFNASILVNVPIFNRGVEYAGIRAAHSASAAKRYAEFDTKKQVLINLKNLVNKFNNLQLQYKANEFSYNAAKISSKTAEEKYRLGQGSFIDFIRTQDIEYEREVALIKVKRDLVATWYSILSLRGKLTAKELNLDADIFKPEISFKKNSIMFIGF